MAFRRHPGAAGSVDRDLRFRQEGPQEQGIRDDTDIGADADNGDLPDLFPILIRRPEDFRRRARRILQLGNRVD